MKISFLTTIMLISIISLSAQSVKADESDGFINSRLNQDTTSEVQNEEQIAVNPLDPDNFVAVWRDFRYGYRQVGYAWTKDGGKTWHNDLFIDPFYPYDSDPGITTDSNGNFYTVVLSYSSDTEPNALFVYKSEDGGETWSGPFTAIDGVPNVFQDKELIACDRSGGSSDGNLYVAWTKFGWATSIQCVRSTNGGVSFEAPVTVGDRYFVQWPVPAVGPDGEVYIAWDSYASYPFKIYLDVSGDEGVSFGSDITVQEVTLMPGAMIHGNIDVFPYPAMDVDMQTGDIYIAFTDYGKKGDTDIFLTKSTDSGATWSERVRVNDDPMDNGCDQFHPWLSVDEKGIVSVLFLDRRDDPANYLYNCYMTWSVDGGKSFRRNIRLSTISSDPQAGSFSDNSFQNPMLNVPIGTKGGLLGEYIGLDTEAGISAAVVWTDTRNGHQDAFSAIPDSTRFDIQLQAETTELKPGDTVEISYEMLHQGEKSLNTEAWIDITLPGGIPFSGNPFDGPVFAPFRPGQDRTGSMMLHVPNDAPAGEGYVLKLNIGYWPYFVLGSDSVEFTISNPS